MNVSVIRVGDLQCNCYLLEKDNEALLVDPGDEIDKIKEFIRDKNIVGIIITHSHYDHVGCVSELVNENHYDVYDSSNLSEGKHNIGSFSFEVINTFGHTMDCLTYYFYNEKMMFTGDFLFYDTIGRCDLEESNYSEMLKSIDKIKKYSDDIIVYPGHGRSTNLGREKMYNYYFR